MLLCAFHVPNRTLCAMVMNSISYFFLERSLTPSAAATIATVQTAKGAVARVLVDHFNLIASRHNTFSSVVFKTKETDSSAIEILFMAHFFMSGKFSLNS